MTWLLTAITLALLLVACAVAVGEGATACVDLDTRSAFVVDSGASAPDKRLDRPSEQAGVACQGGGINALTGMLRQNAVPPAPQQ